MEQRQHIVHIIDSLGFGGAEILLQRTIALLAEYDHTVVYLNGPTDLQDRFPPAVVFHTLGFTGVKSLPRTVLSFRKIVKRTRPKLVHAHLLQSALVARLAVPKSVPLLQSLHSIYSIDAFAKNRKSLWAERFTLRKRHAFAAVSQYVLDDYLRYVPFKGKSFVLYNFLTDDYFRKNRSAPPAEELRCIAIGNLKAAKNYPYLLEVFTRLKGLSVRLDIYGAGAEEAALRATIEQRGLNVHLCGMTADSRTLLPQYGLFVQASAHEGFGLSVIEAMAARVPAFISDIPVFREITGGHAHFFPLNDAIAAAGILKELINDSGKLNLQTPAANAYCKNYYNERVYRENLLRIYKATGDLH